MLKAVYVLITLLLMTGVTPQALAAWNKECRGYTPAKAVRCASARFNPPGGARMALAIYRCESGWAKEPAHSDAYHGVMQYMHSTYDSQRASMPDVQRWFRTGPDPHDMRSAVVTAVAWAARHGWYPWTCGR